MTIYVPGQAAGAAAEGVAWPGREPGPGPAALPFSGHTRVFPPKGLWLPGAARGGLLPQSEVVPLVLVTAVAPRPCQAAGTAPSGSRLSGRF